MQKPKSDQLTEGGQRYTYRDGQWTTTAGYRVSTSHGQALTFKFYERHGREPVCEPGPTKRRRRSA
ncbi:MAG: hypothetical protein JRI23_35370 [Deltaproteobacteria bacterium]|jgi:hypothetical protein|nr:hypothetical protein [Deltaproteobacteria bacterium]MBW2537609.1 hypothetical protein [Deltaproteobacteria bacterium]